MFTNVSNNVNATNSANYDIRNHKGRISKSERGSKMLMRALDSVLVENKQINKQKEILAPLPGHVFHNILKVHI